MHTESHPQANQEVTVNETCKPLREGLDPEPGDTVRIEDWWDKLTGKSWGMSDANPAAMMYAFRAGKAQLPFDDEVVYVKKGNMGHLMHVSELKL